MFRFHFPFMVDIRLEECNIELHKDDFSQQFDPYSRIPMLSSKTLCQLIFAGRSFTQCFRDNSLQISFPKLDSLNGTGCPYAFKWIADPTGLNMESFTYQNGSNGSTVLPLCAPIRDRYCLLQINGWV